MHLARPHTCAGPHSRGLGVGLSLALVCGSALAQNYTGVSVIERFGTVRTVAGDILPSGYPVFMAQDGTVLGHAKTGTTRAFNLATLSYDYRYTLQTLRWAAGNVKSAPAVKVNTSVWPTAGNAQGNWAGYALGSTQIFQGTSLPRRGQDMPAVSINGKVTKINGVTGAYFDPIDMNAQNWVLGTRPPSLARGDEIQAVIWKNGALTLLDSGVARKAFPEKMNDQGDVVGMVRDETWSSDGALLSYTERAALWVNGKLTWLGPDRSKAYSINNQGQFLVLNMSDPGSGWELRTTSGGVTPLQEPDNVSVGHLMINNKGEIGGLYSRYDPQTFRTSPQRPFVWKSGVMIDVYDQLDAKGIALTDGQRNWVQGLVDFNDQGGMLINHDAPFKSTMRINVAP